MVTTFAPSSVAFWAAPHDTFPNPETATVLPSNDLSVVANISLAKYTFPNPVASGRIKLPPQPLPLPVNTPVFSLASFRYMPYKNPISRPPTPMSPAGTSVSGPISFHNSNIKAWQKRMISASDFPLGLKSEPPLPPPIGRVVKEFLKICSNPKNLRPLNVTLG